jgi:pentatricopeptide repeat protein
MPGSEMKRAGFQPNIRSFNALMSACERSEEPDRAIEVFRKIERAHETPTAVTYNTLLSALGKAGRRVTPWQCCRCSRCSYQSLHLLIG